MGSPDHPVLSFGLPQDAAAWLALALACAVPFLPARRFGHRARLFILCALAATLSLGYFFFYLRGAPRIIDATTYLLEARSFAQGSFSFTVPEPTASFRGRFLIHTQSDPTRLSGIFPPGYPALLAFGVLLGAPFAIGPLLGFALAFCTYGLTRAVTMRKEDALVAACLSALCACLRYHTAETMSHGLSALLTVIALWSTVELLRAPRRYAELALGLSIGFLVATRQLNGVALTIVTLGALLFARKLRHAQALRIFVATTPGLVLLFSYHYAVTGDVFVSPQSRYYDFADGPPGCFGLGLGRGCAYEHADVVAQQGGQGLTFLWMLKNTLHRFHFHLMDVAHFEPLLLVGLFAIWRARRRHATWPLAAHLVIIPSAYSLFYFAGSYPGAGARLYAELIPVWHVFIALGLRQLRLTRAGIIACLVGFSLHASFSHRMLAAPHFGPKLAPASHIGSLARDRQAREHEPKPLLFFKTAHEFNLAHLQSDSFLGARRTFDSREELLARNTKSMKRLVYDGSKGFAEFHELSPQSHTPHALAPIVLESEFDYPPLAKHDLWVHPEHIPESCVSRGRALALHLSGPDPQLELEGAANTHGPYAVELRGIDLRGACVTVHLGTHPGGSRIVLKAPVLRNLSHIDHLMLTPTHL